MQKRPGAEGVPTNSHIWDVQKPNMPETTLTPKSPLCVLRFNLKTPDTLVRPQWHSGSPTPPHRLECRSVSMGLRARTERGLG